MKPGVLNVPSVHPFVDACWRDGEILKGYQVSFDCTYVKPFSAYNEWMKDVNIPENVPVEVF
jgi:hypothetical protein